MIVHTGDFRASESLIERIAPHITCPIDWLYIDNTYAISEYTFPPQHKVIQDCCAFIGSMMDCHPKQRVLSPIKRLVVIGSYTIGKERLAVALAKKLKTKIYCIDAKKRAIWKRLEWPELLAEMTDDPAEALIHVGAMSLIARSELNSYLASQPFSHIVGIKPTGWTNDSSANGPQVSFHSHTRAGEKPRKDAIVIYQVPYSEHSSYTELLAFLEWFKCDRIFPTVGNRFGRYIDCKNLSAQEIIDRLS